MTHCVIGRLLSGAAAVSVVVATVDSGRTVRPVTDLGGVSHMKLVVVKGIDTTTMAGVVGPQTYARGLAYASQRAVQHMEWDGAERVLRAVVRGSGGNYYETEAYFEPLAGAELRFAFGECTCPVGFDCKHVVAVVATASGVTHPAGAGGCAHPPEPPSWDQNLAALLGRPARPGAQRAGDTLPLAIELSLSVPPTVAAGTRAPGTPQLLARLVRPGRSGWVNGGLSWSRLESPYSYGDYRASHMQLLRELHALHRSQNPAPSYYVRDDKSIDLGRLSGRLWSWLDEAAEIGLQLVYAGKRFETVEGYGHARLCLDVTTGDGPDALVISPLLRLAGTAGPDGDAMPVLFLGADGHGVVHVSRAQTRREPNPAAWHFWLTRLAQPAAAPLQRMALADQRLPVPAGQQARFGAEYYPRLRQLARVVSSDGSFTPPTISGPILVLQAAYGDDHEVTVDWEWAYEMGEVQMRAPLAPSNDGFRDPAQEKAVLDSLAVPLDRFGGRLRGLDTLRFTTEMLPLLIDVPGITVEVSGQPATYREAGDSLRIGVSTSEVAGDTDWFDLGIEITVDGRQVPFTDVFAALAAGQSHLLLPDGVYFPLDKPQLQALRMLIEEARALQDAPRGPLRISRSRRASGRNWPRWESSSARRRPGNSRSPVCCAPPRWPGRSYRPPCPRSCGPTSARASTGCASCGATGWAASWPTTWGWARRCRHWG
ncbi:MAG TPA: SWIM zinc finger family protein [Pseudonocardiaceae bacterium]|nr:SWIM zinc finger family protein [Pseudonocardiaceae bacterium]